MNRILLFLIPFFFESITSFFVASIPYLAMDLGGNQAQMGVVSTIFIAAQLPLFFIVGKLMDRFGKYPIIYIGCAIITVFIFVTSKSPTLVILTVLGSIGHLGHAIFYPSLQALMGDMSSGEKLTKDVGIYNMGWCFGAAFVALSAPFIREMSGSIKGLLYAGCICGILTAVLVTVNYFMSKNRSKTEFGETDTDDTVPAHNNEYMLMGRLGMFLGFFSYAAYRFILPKILREAGWSDALILQCTGMFMVGEALGIIGCAFLVFWKGKILPQVISNLWLLVCAALVLFVRNSVCLSGMFFVCGVAMAVCYTMALFHAVSSHSRERSRNTGFHEGIVAAGMVGACLFGSLGGKIADVTSIEYFKYLPFYIIIITALFNICVFGILKKKKFK